MVLFWGLHEYVFRFFRDLEFEMGATYVWFLINTIVILYTLLHYPNNNLLPTKLKVS
jgi:hypothetical protein